MVRASQKKYRQSAKGQAAHLRAQRKYLASEQGREVTRAANAAYKRNYPELEVKRVRARQIRKLKAQPGWASQSEIDLTYENAKLATRILGIEYHVDHIVPLRSKRVCGLHCTANLQVIPAISNIQKSNRLWPDMP